MLPISPLEFLADLRADYSLFDRDTGRPVCVGNGWREDR